MRKSMSNFRKYALLLVLVIIASMLVLPVRTFAKNKDKDDNDSGVYYYENDDTGYEAVLFDGADYLTKTEEKAVFEKMKEVTEYTNVCYLTDDNNISESESYSRSLCESALSEFFGRNSDAVIYLVDNEYDYIYAQGDTYDVITSSKAYSITDNVYRYSYNEEFEKGAIEAFDEIYKLLSGKRIAEPMKYICNAFLAIFCAILINFSIINGKSKLKKASIAEMVSGSNAVVNTTNEDVVFRNQERRYSPQSSGSSGGHGGHGGGGHHGGGGGHSH